MTIFYIMLIFTQIIPDFQINSEDYPGLGNQYYTAIACSQFGSTAIWGDFRQSNPGIRPFACCLNSNGDTIGGNYMITDLTGPCAVPVGIAGDAQGNYIAVWVQSDNVNARRFNAAGIPYGPSFVVNNASGYGYRPSIAEDSSGPIAIVWTDNRLGGYKVYGQLYASDGSPIGTNFPVSDSIQSSPFAPDVAANSQNQFVAVWPKAGDIWGQRFDSLGDRIGGEFIINNDSLDISGSQPVVEFNKDGNFIVTWIAATQGQDIYCRVFDSTAVPLTEIIQVNGAPLDSCSWPKVATTDSSWAIVFESGMRAIYLQNLRFNGEMIGENVWISDTTGEMNRYPAIGFNRSVLLITWSRKNYGRIYDIMLQPTAVNGSPVGVNRVISDDRGGSEQLLSEVVADSAGNFFIVWDDFRTPITSYYSNQYGRRFDVNGSPLDDEFMINDRIDAQFSSIARNRSGIYVSVWSRVFSDSLHQIYGQRFDQNGSFLDTNYQISSAPGTSHIGDSKIRNLANGQFIVTYDDDRRGFQYIYGRSLDSLGNPIGNEFITFIDSLTNNSSWGIVDEGGGKFILPMSCERESIGAAIREFDYSGTPISPLLILNELPTEYLYVTGAKGLGRYLFIWQGIGKTKIWGQLLNDSLRKIGNNFLVADDTVAYKDIPTVVTDNNGNFFSIWQDDRMGNDDIYGQFYDSTGNRIGVNFKVDNDTTNSSQRFPSLYSANGLLYIVWSDLRIPKHNYDVYCRVMEWPTLPYAGENRRQNYACALSVAPNPFRTRTDIRLQIPDNREKTATLKIYDAAGRLVKSFSSLTGYPANRLVWNGADNIGRIAPAGVYFVDLVISDTHQIRKIIKIH